MYGKITFKSAESLAEFLITFVAKSTAVFEVEETMNGQFELKFTGAI